MLNKDTFYQAYLLKILPRQLIFIGLIAGIVLIISLGHRSHEESLHEGDIALKSIYAPFDFAVTGEVDRAATEIRRGEAESRVWDIYDIDAIVAEQTISAIDEFIIQLNEVTREEGRSLAEQKFRLMSVMKLKLSLSSLEDLIESGISGELQDDIHDFLENAYTLGIIGSTERKKLIDSGQDKITIRYPKVDIEKISTVRDISTIDDLRLKISDSDFIKQIDQRSLRSSVTELLGAALRVNLRANRELTASRKKSAREKVEPIHKKIDVKENELIISKGERVAKNHLLRLNELSSLSLSSLFKYLSYLIGVMLIVVSALTASVIAIKYYSPEVYASTKSCLLLSLIIIGHLVLVKAVVSSPWSSQIIPIASGGMLTAILLETYPALIVAVLLSLIAAIITGGSLKMLTIFLVASIIGIYMVHAVRRRSQIAKACLTVSLSNFVLVIGFGFFNDLSPEVMTNESLKALVGGLSTFGVVMLALPTLEYLFKITTDISLLELSDLNHPLLKEMIIKAPGTYHHSLVVGNLAEAAASAIGINSLLARVGAYFHDIGKIEKAEYFAENQIELKSKHDKLKPTMSSLIITNHVKDGVELAKKYKLPPEIIDFIQQHHGSGLIHYFYQRALEKVSDEELLKEEGFRYPGPKPQTREAAIVLLADSVEAASRALPEPNAAQLKGLVRRIINNKFIDHQLDECDLTLKDLEKIAEAMLNILTGIYHTRVEYPDKNENNGKSNSRRSSAKSRKNNKTGPKSP